ncbi:hypothetical protein BSL78_09215 [Apostichopus japonicus]|uniref:Uncharacterized protein n=1 Tax=Stichopus japonicus TaxID=307972 RepID=A0A2G8L0W2_STIJA|nr:hypothetical protein BSL78_09215 [Apostichopus japonicus]
MPSIEMDTLENIIQSGQSSGPYPKGTKVLIVETKLQGDILNLGIADVTAATKAVCYNKDIQQKLETGKTFLIRNFQKGRHLVNPPQPQLVSLKDVKLPKPGTPQKLMTITGEIVQDETTRTVASGQEVRNIKIMQDGITRPVALWNTASTSPAKSGDRVTVTYVTVKDDKYLRQLALGTTSQSTITIHEPQTTEALSEISGAEVDEQGNILFMVLHQDDFRQLTLPLEKTDIFLVGATLDSKLQTIGSTKYKFRVQGAIIKDMALAVPPATTSTNVKTKAKKSLCL